MLNNDTLAANTKAENENKNTIFCYSGTGNCLSSARQLSKEFNMPIRLIDLETIERKEKIECDFCIIIFPTYAYAPPSLVRKFIKSCEFKVEYLAALTTCGSVCGGALGEVTRLFRKRGQAVSYANSIHAVENYVHMFGYESNEQIEQATKEQAELTLKVAQDLKQRQTNKKCTFTPFSTLVSCLFKTFKPLFALSYKIKDTCNGCGLCHKICPTRAITLTQKNDKTKPKFKAKQCDHCQACMQLCPQRAIKFMRVTPKSKRYVHKDITISDLIKR